VIQEMKTLELEILGCSEVRCTQSGKVGLDNMAFLKEEWGYFLVHVQQLHFLDIGQYRIESLLRSYKPDHAPTCARFEEELENFYDDLDKAM